MLQPISDKDRFLQSLSGANELDIPIRQDKTKTPGLRRSRENSPVRIQRLVHLMVGKYSFTLSQLFAHNPLINTLGTLVY